MKSQLTCVLVLIGLFTIGLFGPAPAQSQEVGEELLTVAERSDWQGTATHAEVVQLIFRLADRSPLIHVEETGKTFQKKSLPIMVIADPPVKNPTEVGDRLVAFAWAGIHSGEVCGKPATLMLAREIATTKNHPLLKNLVVIFLPLLNADGNDLMSPDNRPGQLGPILGMGTRANAMGLNINRDFMKLDSPAAQAVVKVLNRWDPAIAMDLHTTNGSRHRYTLTYDGQRHPACDDDLRKLTRYELLPWVTKTMRANTGYETNVYGNFRGDRWVIDDALPRYSTHSIGMRNHISVLSEAYSYAPYKDRVLGTREFVRYCFRYVSENKEAVMQRREKAKQRTIELGNNPSIDNLVALRRQPDFGSERIEILGYENLRNRGDAGEPRSHSLFYNDLSKPTLSVTRPFGYVVPERLKEVHKRLKLHGISVSTLKEDLNLEVEVYRVDELERAETVYEGHQLVTVEVTPRTETRKIKAGTPIVRTGQPLGTLAAYLLEPQSEDGFCAWNFLDDELTVDSDFPVLRLPAAIAEL
ncbi:M14 family metallopeptidase [Neorhodopirellula lusitana]|uniref:M14 family metallopeptidase n=1 Tax=Neorhodopirellula lusitana TaxID=445327 RepID=UPI00384A4DF3